MTDRTPITLHGGRGILNGAKFEGTLVPETNGLFAVDERHKADPSDPEDPGAEWYITHVPTMYRINKNTYTEAATREQAEAKAQCFYRECLRRGWNVASDDPDALTIVHNVLPEKERRQFWERIRAAGEAAGPRVTPDER